MQSNKEELRYLKMIPPFFSVKKQQERGGRASATAEVADGGHVDQELIAVVLPFWLCISARGCCCCLDGASKWTEILGKNVAKKAEVISGL